MNSEDNTADTFVKNALVQFVKKQTNEDAANLIDEILLSYVVGILETLGQLVVAEDSFDVNEFKEMLSAYIPCFVSISDLKISEWVLELADKVVKLRQEGERMPSSPLLISTFTESSAIIKNGQFPKPPISPAPQDLKFKSRSRNSSQSEEDRKPNHIAEDNLLVEKDFQTLCEMFPHVCNIEVRRCLMVAGGDTEMAAQILLQQDSSSLPISITCHKPNTRRDNGVILGDRQLRQQILSRYAYIDQEDDNREHRPVAPKTEPKKLIRYRDNKVVSIKGEKYSEVKSEESDDMKKTYVTLKPARQYRFH